MANVTENRVNTTIPVATFSALKTQIKSMGTSMPFLVTLSDAQRKSYFSLDVSNKVFVEEALDELVNNGAMMPAVVDASFIKNDLELFEQLDTLESMLTNMLNLVIDTKRTAAHEAYTNALMVYKLFGLFSASAVPEAKQSYDRLSRRFEQTARDSSEETPIVPPAE